MLFVENSKLTKTAHTIFKICKYEVHVMSIVYKFNATCKGDWISFRWAKSKLVQTATSNATRKESSTFRSLAWVPSYVRIQQLVSQGCVFLFRALPIHSFGPRWGATHFGRRKQCELWRTKWIVAFLASTIELGFRWIRLSVLSSLHSIAALSHHGIISQILLSGVFVVERNSRRQEVGERHWWGDVRTGEAHSENQVTSLLNIIHLICIQVQ